LVRRFDHHAFVLGDGLATRFFNALPDNELMNFRHDGTVPSYITLRNIGVYLRKLLEGT